MAPQLTWTSPVWTLANRGTSVKEQVGTPKRQRCWVLNSRFKMMRHVAELLWCKFTISQHIFLGINEQWMLLNFKFHQMMMATTMTRPLIWLATAGSTTGSRSSVAGQMPAMPLRSSASPSCCPQQVMHLTKQRKAASLIDFFILQNATWSSRPPEKDGCRQFYLLEWW